MTSFNTITGQLTEMPQRKGPGAWVDRERKFKHRKLFYIFKTHAGGQNPSYLFQKSFKNLKKPFQKIIQKSIPQSFKNRWNIVRI